MNPEIEKKIKEIHQGYLIRAKEVYGELPKRCYETKFVIGTNPTDKLSSGADSEENIVYIHSLGYDITGTNFAEGIDWEDSKYVSIVAQQLEKLCQFYIDHPEIKPVPLINMAIHKCAENKEKTKWCGCGEHMVAYETDGSKHPCTFMTPMTFSSDILDSIRDIDYKDPKYFIDEECFNNCYLNPVCTSCYGANLLSNGKINVRDKSKCELTKIRAVFSAALRAHKILSDPSDSPENSKAIIAIKKIQELYN